MLSYSVADFLAYDKSIWLAMVARYLADWWWLGMLASALLIVGVARWLAPRAKTTPRFVFLVLSVCWAWIAWRFHWHEHRSLNWAAGYWSLAFAFQAGMLGLTGLLIRARSEPLAPAFRTSRRLVWLTVTIALLGPALLGWSIDATPFFGFEWFGLTPDATALMTLLLLVHWREGGLLMRVALAIVPALSLTVSALFTHSLGISSTAILVGVGLVAMMALFSMNGLRSSQIRTAS